MDQAFGPKLELLAHELAIVLVDHNAKLVFQSAKVPTVYIKGHRLCRVGCERQNTGFPVPQGHL